MKKFGWTYLFIAVVVALVGFTIFDFQRAEKVETKKEEALAVLNFDPLQITVIEFLSRGEVKRLEKTNGQWLITQPFQDSADQQAVASFLESLKSERIQEVVKEGDNVDLATYGLQVPLFSLKLTTSGAGTNASTNTLNLGSVKAYDGSLYGQIEGQKRVLLLSSAWDVYLSKPARELRDKRVYRGDPKAKAVALKIVSAEFSLELKKDSKGAWVAAPNSGNKISDSAVDAYIELVKALRAFDYMAVEKSNLKALSSVGLDRPRYRLEIKFEDQAKPFTLAFAQSRSPDDGNIPTLSSDLALALVVYKVAASKILVPAKQFFDSKAPFSFAVSDVAQIKINVPNLKSPVIETFQKSGTDWIRGLQTPADSTKLNELIEKLSRLEAVRFYDAKTFPSSRMSSSIQLLKEDGTVLLHLSWGSTATEPAAGDKPEAVVLPVRSNKTEDVLGLAEGSILNLALEKLL